MKRLSLFPWTRILEEIPPPQPRSFGFSFGTLCQDSAEEPTEQFRVTVWFQPAGVADPDPVEYPVLQYLVRIIDDDGEGGSETFEISPAAFTVRETDEDAPAVLALTFGEARDVDYCFPFELVYSRSTAGASRCVGRFSRYCERQLRCPGRVDAGGRPRPD